MTNKTKGILCITLSALSFALMAVFIKLSGDLPSVQKSLFRNVMGVIVVGSLIYKNKIDLREVKHFKLLTLRSVLGTVGVITNFYAVDHLYLADANIISRLSTFFLLIFSFLFLNEKVSVKQIIAIVIAFIGAAFVIRPQFSAEIVPYIIALTGALCAGGAYTVLRALGKKEHPLVVVFYFSSFSTLVLLPLVLTNFVTMTTSQIFALILAGVFATFGQFGVTFAYKFAPASEISIYNFIGVIFSAILGFILFNQSSDYMSYIGYITIFSASFYMFKQKKA